MSSTYILVAVGDPVLHPEATHIAAATGHGVIDTLDPREITRLLPRAHLVLVDADTAAHVATLDRRNGIHFLAADPGPVDWRAAMRCHADNAWVLPAQAAELLAELGHVAVSGGTATQVEEGSGTFLAVCGAAGGAGTSTIAAAVARSASRVGPVTHIDADERSGGLDLLLGLEETPGARWPDLRLGEGLVDGSDLRAALPAAAGAGHDIAVLSAARSTLDDPFRLSADSLRPVLEALRGTRGITVIDLPPDASLLEVVGEYSPEITLVVPAEVRPAAAAARLVAHLRRNRTEVSAVVRNRHWAGLTPADVESIIRCPVITDLSTVPRLARSAELGGLPERMPGQLSATARLILEQAGVLR